MNNESPQVSVIIPLYNAEDYIKVTLMSLQNQTLQDFEVVIVDDCSTDTSLAIVNQFKEEEELGDKIRVITLEKNGGISNTRNVGLNFSKGKYVTFLDNDDLLVPKALETFVDIADEWQAEVVHTHSHYQNPKDANHQGEKILFRMASFEHGNKKNLKSPPYLLTNDMSERMTNFSIYGIDWNVWGKLFRRDFLMINNIRFPKIKLTEDLIFVFQTLLFAKKYIMIPDGLYIYRYRNDSTLHKDRDKNFLRKIIGVQIEGTKILNDLMDGVEHFADHFEDREKVINFYMNLELLATKLMQKKFNDREDYFEMLCELYAEHFGKDATFIAFIHRIANQAHPNTAPPWPTEE